MFDQPISKCLINSIFWLNSTPNPIINERDQMGVKTERGVWILGVKAERGVGIKLEIKSGEDEFHEKENEMESLGISLQKRCL